MKIRITAVAAVVFCALMLAVSQLASAAEEFKGTWTVARATEAGKVRFGLQHRTKEHNSQHESDWPLDAFQGADFASPGRRDVQFVIARDAGRFDCKGFVEDGEGAGNFRFTPDAGYTKQMGGLGFGDVDAYKQFAMAVHDVSVEFARRMKAEKLSGLDTDKLIAFRIFDVNPQFIRELRAEGLPAENADRLIAFRVHGVTPQYVREIREAGIVADEDELIAFRVHGVTPEYVRQVEKLGFATVDPDQLVAMRVHGVTPEFIASLKARGLKDLTIDKLVALRVHGID